MAAPNLITPLRDICVKVVAANFEGCPTFGPLPDKYVKRIIDILPLDLPLELVGSVSPRKKLAMDMPRPSNEHSLSLACSRSSLRMKTTGGGGRKPGGRTARWEQRRPGEGACTGGQQGCA